MPELFICDTNYITHKNTTYLNPNSVCIWLFVLCRKLKLSGDVNFPWRVKHCVRIKLISAWNISCSLFFLRCAPKWLCHMLEIWGNSEKPTFKYTWAINNLLCVCVSQVTEVNMAVCTHLHVVEYFPFSILMLESILVLLIMSALYGSQPGFFQCGLAFIETRSFNWFQICDLQRCVTCKVNIL